MHVDSIFKDGELPEEATHKKFLLVQTEGKRQVQRSIDHYNLEELNTETQRWEIKLN
jgi:hypothetical protein